MQLYCGLRLQNKPSIFCPGQSLCSFAFVLLCQRHKKLLIAQHWKMFCLCLEIFCDSTIVNHSKIHGNNFQCGTQIDPVNVIDMDISMQLSDFRHMWMTRTVPLVLYAPIINIHYTLVSSTSGYDYVLQDYATFPLTVSTRLTLTLDSFFAMSIALRAETTRYYQIQFPVSLSLRF